MINPVHAHTLSCFSRVRLFATYSTVAHQAPLSMEYSRQEYWNGLRFPSSEDLLDPRIEPVSLEFPELAGRFFTTEPCGKFINPVSQANLGNFLNFLVIIPYVIQYLLYLRSASKPRSSLHLQSNRKTLKGFRTKEM